MCLTSDVLPEHVGPPMAISRVFVSASEEEGFVIMAWWMLGDLSETLDHKVGKMSPTFWFPTFALPMSHHPFRTLLER